MMLDLLPDALDVLYSQGIGACLEIYPDLQPHRAALLRLRSAEAALTGAEGALESAADLLHRLEQGLVDRLILQGYNPPRGVPRESLGTPLPRSWTLIAWLLQRMRLLLNTTTPPPFRFITSDSLSKSGGSGGDAPTGSLREGSGSTTPASAAPVTPSGPSTGPEDQASGS